MEQEKLQQNSLEQVQSAYERLLKLRVDTGRCAEEIIDLLQSNDFIDQDKADSILDCVREMTSVQNQICTFLKQNNLVHERTLISVHNAIAEYEQKCYETAKKKDIVKSLNRLSTVYYSGSDDSVIKAVDKVKSDVRDIIDKLNQLSDYVSETQKYLDLLGLIEESHAASIAVNKLMGLLQTFGQENGGALMIAINSKALSVKDGDETGLVLTIEKEPDTAVKELNTTALTNEQEVELKTEKKQGALQEIKEDDGEKDDFRPISLAEDDKVILLDIKTIDHSCEEKLISKNIKGREFKNSLKKMFSKYQFSDSMNLLSNIANIGYYSSNFDFKKIKALRKEIHIKEDENLLAKIEVILQTFVNKGYLNRYDYFGDVFYTLSKTVLKLCSQEIVHNYLEIGIRFDESLSNINFDEYDLYALRFYLADRIRHSLQKIKIEPEDLPDFPLASGTTIKVKRNKPYRIVYIPLIADVSNYEDCLNQLYELIKGSYSIDNQYRNYLALISDKLQKPATFIEYFKDLGFDEVVVFKIDGKEEMPVVFNEQGNEFGIYEYFEDAILVEDDETEGDECGELNNIDNDTDSDQIQKDQPSDVVAENALAQGNQKSESQAVIHIASTEETPSADIDDSSVSTGTECGKAGGVETLSAQGKVEEVITTEAQPVNDSKEDALANNKTEGNQGPINKAIIMKNIPTISEGEIENILEKATMQLEKQCLAETMLLLHSLKQRTSEPWAKNLCEEVGYILNDPLQINQSDGFRFIDESLQMQIPGVSNGLWSDYFSIAAYIKSFFRPVNVTVNGYRLKEYWGRIKEENTNSVLQEIPKIKELIGYFKTFAEKTGQPFSACLNTEVLDSERISKKRQELFKKVRVEQTRLLEDAKKNKIRNERIHALHNVLFGNNGEISRYFDECMLLDLKSLLVFCQKFTEVNLKEVNDAAILEHKDLLLQGAVDQYIDDSWTEINKTVSSKKKINNRLTGSARTGVISTMSRALNVLLQYVVCSQLLIDQDGERIDAEQAQSERKKALHLLLDIRPALAKLQSDYFMDQLSLNCLRVLINGLIKQIDNPEKANEGYYDSLLQTGYIEMDGNLPDVHTEYEIPEFDLYSRCVKHLAEMDIIRVNVNPSNKWQSAYNNAFKKLNIGVCKTIEEKYPEWIEKIAFETQEKELPKYIDDQYEEFIGDLELAYDYGQITDREAFRQYVALAAKVRDHCKETENLGFLNTFIQGCKNNISKKSAPRQQEMNNRFLGIKEALKKRYNAEQRLLETNERSSLNDEEYVENRQIVRQIQECLDDNNLTVAEDYMNLWEKENYTKIPDNVSAYHGTFEKFISEYQSYYDICIRGKSLTMNRIWDSNKDNSLFSKYNGNQIKGAGFFLAELSKIGRFKEANIKELLKQISFSEEELEVKIKERLSNNSVLYQVKFLDKPKIKESYSTPFEIFGTGIYKRGLQVIVFTGNHTAKNVINEIERAPLDHDTGTICFVDYAMPLADRRETAAMIKTAGNLQNIIIIDRVLALYLAPIEKLERKNRLLQLTLPFAFVQPYLSDASAMAAEMFIGRTDELRKIKDMKGPVLVYGGRQLGKSALLRQVRYIEHYPQENSYAYFIDIKQKDSTGTLRAIGETLKLEGLLKKIPKTWDDFSYEIKTLLSENSKVMIKKLLLLLDEADAFLVSAAHNNNIPIEILKNLKDNSDGKFKFVLAGLHNVIRYDKQHLAGNSVYAHLGHVLVKPFEFTDASELLSKPMSYLGFQIKTPAMMSTIFSKANYFPGLIQFYCYKLVEAVKDNYLRKNFDMVNNPPYNLDREYLKSILKDDSFKENIEEKFIITLKLDEDNYYDIIALAVAYYYYQNKSEITLEDIYSCCEDFNISKITDMEEAKLEALMDEMIELNILRKDENGNYGFNRYNFFNMMGKNEDEIWDKLISYEG